MKIRVPITYIKGHALLDGKYHFTNFWLTNNKLSYYKMKTWFIIFIVGFLFTKSIKANPIQAINCKYILAFE